MNAGPGPHHNMPMNPVQMAQAQAHANEVARRRSRKPTDKTLPAGVEDCIIGDGAQRYKELRDFERRLDATMTRKRLDIVDSVTRSVKVCSPTPPISPWLSHWVTDLLPALQGTPDLDQQHGGGSDVAERRAHHGHL